MHVHAVVFDEKIPALDEFAAHLLGKVGVLEVGGVIYTGREHDDLRTRGASRRKLGKGGV